MNDDVEQQLQAAWEQAFSLPHGPAKVGVLEEAVRLADAHQLTDVSYQIRKKLIEAAVFGGQPERALVAFTWCLAQCDRDPEEYPEGDLLWTYKWVAAEVPDFPQITRQQILDILADMELRYRRNGFNPGMAHKYRCRAAFLMGDVDEASKYRRAWDDSARDAMSDCAACEADSQIEYLLFLGEDEEALEKAKPIVRGALRCAEVPHITLSLLLLPLFRLGRPDEAMEQHRRGYRLIVNNRKMLHGHARHMTFLVLTDNLARAGKLFEKHLPWVLESANKAHAFGFYLSGLFLCRRLMQAGKKTAPFRLPGAMPVQADGGKCALPELAGWLEQECQQLAARFDERNGNRFFAGRLAELPELEKQVTPVPLKTAKDDLPAS